MQARLMFILVVCVGAAALMCGCATTQQTDTSRVEELQAQLIELQKSQAALGERMDELQTTMLVLQEANRLTHAQIDGMERRMTTPRITITGPPATGPEAGATQTEPPAEEPPTPSDERTTGRGGEFVAPPPQLDPTLSRVPSDAARDARIDAGLCRIEPSADLLADPAFAAAWAEHEGGRFAVAVFDWNEVVVGGGGPRRVTAARYYLADAYFELKEYDQAGSLFEAVAGQPEAAAYRPCAAFRVGRCLELRGKIGSAIEKYRAVIQQYPGTQVAGKARARLTELESNTSH